jgi:hypothetical protein
VGTRCPDCANLRRLPQFEVPAAFLLRGLGAALAAGVALGTVWAFLLPFRLSLFFALLVGLGLGYAIGEAVSAATNRKVGPQLQAVAALGIVVAYALRLAIEVSASARLDLVEALNEDLAGYIVAGLAVVVAFGRLRR